MQGRVLHCGRNSRKHCRIISLCLPWTLSHEYPITKCIPDIDKFRSSISNSCSHAISFYSHHHNEPVFKTNLEYPLMEWNFVDSYLRYHQRCYCFWFIFADRHSSCKCAQDHYLNSCFVDNCFPWKHYGSHCQVPWRLCTSRSIAGIITAESIINA